MAAMGLSVSVIAACEGPSPVPGQAATGASGMEARMSLDQLVSSSALVVLGTLEAITPGAGSGMKPDLGRLKVEEQLYTANRAAKPVTEVGLLLPSKGGLVASDTVFYTVGQRGVWFLRAEPGGGSRYLADNSQRLQPVSVLEDLRRIVKGKGE